MHLWKIHCCHGQSYFLNATFKAAGESGISFARFWHILAKKLLKFSVIFIFLKISVLLIGRFWIQRRFAKKFFHNTPSFLSTAFKCYQFFRIIKFCPFLFHRFKKIFMFYELFRFSYSGFLKTFYIISISFWKTMQLQSLSMNVGRSFL